MEIDERPYRCTKCNRVFYAEGNDVTQPNCPGYRGNQVLVPPGITVEVYGAYSCDGQGIFIGHPDKAPTTNVLGFVNVSLGEDHRWEEYGMLNPHAVPLRNTPAWDKYMKEGRIVRDEKGRECLYSRDKKQYIQTLNDLGYTNGYGEGTMNKSRQQGEHYRDA